jgi:chromosome segregation ATPase
VPEIPPEAIKAVHQATALIWSIANEHQIEAITAIQQEYSRSEQEAIAERDEAMNEVALLEEKLRASEEQVKALLAKDTARASEVNTLELQIHKQQLALDSTVNQNAELKTEMRDLREKTSTAQNESARLAGMLEAYKSQAQQPAPTPEAPPAKAIHTAIVAGVKPEPKAPTPKKSKTTPKKQK